jgi:GT2 family glycosyltransferase
MTCDSEWASVDDDSASAAAGVVTAPESLTPRRVLVFELAADPAQAVSLTPGLSHPYQRASVLIRLHGVPLGVLDAAMRDDHVDTGDLVERAWDTFGADIREHLRQDGYPDVDRRGGIPAIGEPACAAGRERARTGGPRATVVVATHERPAGLARALESLLSMEYADYEIVVVDNAPVTNATRDLLRRQFADVENLRYVTEHAPGLTPARIKGVEASTGEIVAFTDDDVIADPYWLAGLVTGFEREEPVACVTGLTLPLELDTRAQFLFEEYGGFAKGFLRRVYNNEEYRPADRVFPYAVARVGSGNNMAWNKDLLDRIGGFDLALTETGAEDISAFFDAITKGYTIVYEPAAIVFHEHRRDYRDLHRQVQWYGIGLGAYLTRCVMSDAKNLPAFAAKAPSGLVHLLSPRSPKNVKKSDVFPRELTRLERRYTWRGVLLYLRGRRREARRRRASFTSPEASQL